jgi:acyl-CoA thioester hydrolase
LEEEGVMLPVHDMHVTYHQPARYDDLITVRTILEAMPSVRAEFRYEIYSSERVLLTEARITLVFIDRASMKPCRAPKALLDALAVHLA